MAEVMMSKACMFSPSYSIPNHHHPRSRNHPFGVSLLPIKSAIFASGLRASSCLKLRPFSLRSSSSASNSEFYDRRFLLFQGLEGIPNNGSSRSSSSLDVHAQMRTGLIGKTQKWWEKGLQPNMTEVQGAQHLVDSLLKAGDRLVVVDYFSPGCGGCKALHPKICQFAEMNPDVEFLQVNYEEHKSMCGSLNVHVLPFFRFYRGAHGRLCSFSCTNATIKKFKDALAKHSPDRCSLGPPKGLEEKELVALAANQDLSFNYTPKPEVPMPIPAQGVIFAEMTTVPPASHSETYPPLSLPLPSTSTNAAQGTGDKHLVASGR